ncbi:MAG: hypothetical protein RR311_05570 [Comamonas sp.]
MNFIFIPLMVGSDRAIRQLPERQEDPIGVQERARAIPAGNCFYMRPAQCVRPVETENQRKKFCDSGNRNAARARPPAMLA